MTQDEKIAEEILSYSGNQEMQKGMILSVLQKVREEERNLAFEEWARFCVRRMCYWKEEDIKESLEFRKGIEKVCSDMCVYFRTRTSDETPPYLERQAIEHAIKKCGMRWGSNKTRLDFYEYFESFIKQVVDKIIAQAIRNLK